MNKVANSYWTDARLDAQQPAPRALTFPLSAAELSRELVGTRAEVRRRGGIIPSWVAFTMIMLATFALCLSVTMRTHAQMQSAGQRYAQMDADVQTLRNSNDSLRREVERLREDPRAIESAARTRLNMVRANEIVIPVE
ncbi:MAG: septum formation initiator family protein [Acidobacteria bacterium]|nr:septum formation initiator family protein [Acidobacteriota bacterium]